MILGGRTSFCGGGEETTEQSMTPAGQGPGLRLSSLEMTASTSSSNSSSSSELARDEIGWTKPMPKKPKR